MRKDENGGTCPETLGEYYDLCAAIGGADCEAAAHLMKHINEAENGRDEKVIPADSQMRAWLMPRLAVKAKGSLPTNHRSQAIQDALDKGS